MLKNLNFILLTVISLCAIEKAASAALPTIAFSDRTTWPEAINSPENFDRASRAEILVFANALSEISAVTDPVILKEKFHIKQVNLASIAKIKNQLFARLMENWQAASVKCLATDLLCNKINSVEDMISVATGLKLKIPTTYSAWLNNAEPFHRSYAAELIRLAALFPEISSEIDTFSPNEHQGFELPDRQFLLTFDDGPTDANGNTDKLLPILSKAQLHASFYLLGERLQARLKQSNIKTVQSAYEGQCTAMHGWEHKAHTKWEQWRQSVTSTKNLVKATFPNLYRPWFRPPYGQRRADSSDFFKNSELQVALWNIDSQDWNDQVSGIDAAHRVFTLMLLWRRGVILFHDVHPKAQIAIPWLVDHVKETSVTWAACQNY